MLDIETETLGLIGYPLGHSISPLLHNHACKKLDLNYVYLPFEIEPDNLKRGIAGIKALKIKGVNVTIPYKKKVIPYLDKLDDMAEEIGAVNTIINNGQKLYGYNTDASGFKKMLNQDADFHIKGKKALLIGAGGASRAVGAVLCQNGIQELTLINRTRDKADKLADSWKKQYPGLKINSGGIEKDFYNSYIKDTDIVIDTTPVGMAPETDVEPVISTELFHSNLLVVDLVYNPPETTILKAAREVGAETLNGLTMLLYQASDAFELWTGQKPDIKSWYQLVANEMNFPHQ